MEPLENQTKMSGKFLLCSLQLLKTVFIIFLLSYKNFQTIHKSNDLIMCNFFATPPSSIVLRGSSPVFETVFKTKSCPLVLKTVQNTSCFQC